MADLRKAAHAAAVPLTVVEDDRKGGRERYDARHILLRPDQFVAWTSDAAPAEAGAVLRQAIGNPPQR